MNVEQLRKKICLSVRIAKGIVKLADGNALPKMNDGTLADLLVPVEAFRESEESQPVSDDEILLLGKNTALWARVNSDKISADLAKYRISKTTPQGKSVRCVQIDLKQDLRLIPKNKKPSLSPCRCFIPSLQEEAESVNEAYKKVSLGFEPTRR